MSIKKYRILAVDDDPSILKLFETILGREYELLTAACCEEAKKISYEQDFQVVLLDLGLPDGDGLDMLKFFKELNQDVEIIIVTMQQEVKKAVEAIRNGAYEYIDKSFEPAALTQLVHNALTHHLRQKKILSLQSEIEHMVATNFVLGQSPKMQKIYQMVEKTAKVPANVLITGESGTGKEVIARRIHQLSDNADAPFIAVNMASIPSELMESTLFGHEKGAFTSAHRLQYGKFELADGGTLFLDEIGEVRFDLQAKLLRALQDHVIERVGGLKPIHVKVRVVAATNADLEQKVKEGKFREDLYYRLNVVRLHLPPLRERLEDIPDFVRYFIRKYNEKFHRDVQDISELVLSVLSHYTWPGNIRELENLVERLIALSEKSIISEGDIPVEYLVNDFESLRRKSPDGDVLVQATEAFERNFILKILEREKWNQTKTAACLGIHRKTLEYKIKKYDLGAIITQKRPLAS